MNAIAVPPGRHPVRIALCRAVEAAMQVVIDVRARAATSKRLV